MRGKIRKGWSLRRSSRREEEQSEKMMLTASNCAFPAPVTGSVGLVDQLNAVAGEKEDDVDD